MIKIRKLFGISGISWGVRANAGCAPPMVEPVETEPVETEPVETEPVEG